jgi:hypothetical protein
VGESLTPADACPPDAAALPAPGYRQPDLGRPATIEQALAVILGRHPEGVLLVHGACPRGADAIGSAYAARTPAYQIEAHPADWHRYGRAAGHRRNTEMITFGADGCVAFIQDASPGSTTTVRLAEAAGIPIWLHTRP